MFGFIENWYNLTNINNILYFSAQGGNTGTELWKSDGTEIGTALVKDIQSLNFDLNLLSSNPANFTNVNGTVYFIANQDIKGQELWKSDGTAAGTVLVKDINPNSFSSNPFPPFPSPSFGVSSNPSNLTNVNSTLYFTANDGTTGAELWKTDGTEAGTVLVKDINPGASSSALSNLTNINGTLYFTANDGVQGNELWKSDGTATGTVLVKDLAPGSDSSDPENLVNLNGLLYFTAYDSVHGRELWQSDGTAAGTKAIDLVPGSTSSLPANLTNVNGTLFFSALDPTTKTFSLWKLSGGEPLSIQPPPPIGLFQQKPGDVFNLASSNSTTTLKVTVNHRTATVSDLGFFTVDDAQGSINGLLPTDLGYNQAAFARARVLLAEIANRPNGYAPSTSDLTHLLNLTSNQYLRFYLLNTPTTTTDARNGVAPNVQFSPVQTITDKGNGEFSLDFQNISITAQTSTDSIPLGTALQGTVGGNVFDLRDVAGTVNATFTVNREAAYNNFVGFYAVSNSQGDIRLSDGSIVKPGDANYAQIAVQNRVAGINLQVANQGTATLTGQFSGGSILAPFLIANGTVEQVLSGQATQVFFNYVGANADGVDHVRLLGNNTFGFEDLLGGGDRDFNDVIVRAQLTTA